MRSTKELEDVCPVASLFHFVLAKCGLSYFLNLTPNRLPKNKEMAAFCVGGGHILRGRLPISPPFPKEGRGWFVKTRRAFPSGYHLNFRYLHTPLPLL